MRTNEKRASKEKGYDAFDSFKTSFANSWLPEFLALLISLLSTVVIFGLLTAYNGQDITRWHFPAGVTLNAVISTFSTISKGFLAVAVSAGLGQWKWLWFQRRSRSLKAFAAFDRSSRGPWGSMQLLFSTKLNTALLLGSLVTVLSLLVDPFMQQVLTYQVESLPKDSDGAAVPVARRYSQGFEFPQVMLGIVNAFMDFSLDAALLRGFAQDADTITAQLPFSCSSGNCTFEALNSLAICSSCNNVTSSLAKTVLRKENPQFIYTPMIATGGLPNHPDKIPAPRSTKYSLPDGTAIWNADGKGNARVPGMYQVAMTAHGKLDPNQTVSFRNDDLLIFAVSIIRADYTMQSNGEMTIWPNVPVTATECALSFCAKRILSSVENGVLTEKIKALPVMRSVDSFSLLDGVHGKSKHGTPQAEQQGVPQPVNSLTSSAFNSTDHEGYWNPRSDLQVVVKDDTGESFNVSQISLDSIQLGFVSNGMLMADSPDTTHGVTSNMALLQRNTSTILSTNSFMRRLWLSSNTTQTFENLALSMTNQLRQSDDKHTFQKGRTYSNATIIRVQWAWTTLPLGLVLLGCIFTALTASKTRKLRQAIWKDECLPILFHGLDQPSLLTGSRPPNMRDMEDAAATTKVQLVGQVDQAMLAVSRTDSTRS